MKQILSISLMLAWLPATFAMRCQGQLVSIGDSTYSVEKKCGKPLHQEITTSTENIFNAEGYRIGTVEKKQTIWIYQQNPQSFRYELTFEGGKLVKKTANRT